jgi:hypothetical protein
VTFQYCLFFFLSHLLAATIESPHATKNFLLLLENEKWWWNVLGWECEKFSSSFLKSHNIATLILRYSRHASRFAFPVENICSEILEWNYAERKNVAIKREKIECKSDDKKLRCREIFKKNFIRFWTLFLLLMLFRVSESTKV